MFYKLLEFFVADRNLEITETTIEIIKIENAIYIRVIKKRSHPFWPNNLIHKTTISNNEFSEKLYANNYIMSLLYDIHDSMADIDKLTTNVDKLTTNVDKLATNVDINTFNIKKINYKNIMEDSKQKLYDHINNYILLNI